MNADSLFSQGADFATEYSSEVIEMIIEVAELDAELEKGLFNEYSIKLDIILFGYYSNAYKQKRAHINQNSSCSSNHPSCNNLSDYESRLKESIALWSTIKRAI